MSRYAYRRKDGTHNAIAKAFEKLGYSVFDTSALGGSFPDMVIARARTLTALIEAKSKDGKLSEGQKRFRDGWRGLIFECRTLDDVVKVDERMKRVMIGDIDASEIPF